MAALGQPDLSKVRTQKMSKTVLKRLLKDSEGWESRCLGPGAEESSHYQQGEHFEIRQQVTSTFTKW